MPIMNRALSIADLPSPPPEKTGWPWTEQSDYLPAQTANNSTSPRISIVTPSYNQGEFIEETIRSVLLQSYPNLEYIVIDGGSTDNSIEIIKKYEKFLAYWVSEPDRGQTHAINKGLEKSTGEIWAYLNSDDLFCPNSLYCVSKYFQGSNIHWVGGVSDVFDETGHRGYIEPKRPEYLRDYLTPWSRNLQYVFPCSNVCFMHREVLNRCGFFDESYHYGMDIEYYVRIVLQMGIQPKLAPDLLGRWRWHSDSKTLSLGIAFGFREDEVRMATQYLSYFELEDQAALISDIQEQKRWLVTRRAMFYKEKRQIGRAWYELLTALVEDLSLLQFRPWLGAFRRLIIS
jgi:glycosyltransferase involved in cell wall biosynthesis